jgi:hypothetical protein
MDDDNWSSNFTGQVHGYRRFSGSGRSPEMHWKSGFYIGKPAIGDVFDVIGLHEVWQWLQLQDSIHFVVVAHGWWVGKWVDKWTSGQILALRLVID